MAGKRLDVLSPRPKKDGGTYWHRVGTAWEGEKGISISFDSMPLPDKDGQVRVSLFEPRESKGSESRSAPADARPPMGNGPARGRVDYAQDMNDDIPFMPEYR